MVIESTVHHINFYPRSHVGNDNVPFIADKIQIDFYPRSHVGNDCKSD